MGRALSSQGRWLLLLAGASAPLLLCPAARAGEIPYWPTERDQRIAVVEACILGTQRRISEAAYHGREEAILPLLRELQNLRKQELQLRGGPAPSDAALFALPPQP